ncbi:hypothetical protein [Ketogulonicigenium vulgare]|uniref:Uncharacterized protein n=1 Tax=Ketogulonicigenium vulgare (strain WSH-001) TaxID=759362 RepID=F9Y8F8_KETVW|nr:hypothetical protein [Ketogulonicigenium vulgare]ADO41732.1 conserved hypothetical protein [Ketogulonicigenium vulgare Y25]AEM39967.1 hypothetical protein KVU_0129 [Ketogulonicigenium vulgare WSH-001]ALJ80174.1 hypothetical protein KVH_02685 [Ketogulonicigenium vulgare]ANW33038.1 hypothetical protein KvSKV_02680 [Ketogulonicigenium vulgare]AOZ53663.1 hypothetical protein KVC_0639 [Ketogulonicigenium vulgare]
MKPSRSPSSNTPSQASQNTAGGLAAAMRLPLIAGGLWVILSLVMIFAFPGEPRTAFDGLRFMVAVLVIILPLGLIGLAVLLSRIAEVVATPTAPLVPAAAETRAPRPAAAPARKADAEDVPPMPAIAMPAATSRAPAQPRQPAHESAPPAPEVQPLSRAQMVRALNFPDSAEDYAGFEALSNALTHPRARAVVQSAQDILTLLSQDGLYMDDMRPYAADPGAWRAFAASQRGAVLESIGRFPDESALSRAAARLKADAIFRDTAQHFLRNFDQMFRDFENGASDDDLQLMAETRSARAFVLIGRAAGSFG